MAIAQLLTFPIDSAIILQNIYRLRNRMELVKISPKYQIVIPKNVRTALRLKPGQKIQVIAFGDRIELVPERKIGEMRGFLRGINTDFEREGERL
jgi:AbrB family looped-hinge helix DNA binding protein